ncbi:MAG: MaoC/PaaZ C-terminal domain-containing protein [Hyphomicrobiaceae bacterium]
MVLDPARLMAHDIPEVRQRITARDCILYALSIGFGEDPLDPRQLDFVDAHRPLKIVPSMAVVLGHPGFWLGDPKLGVDAVRLVHGEQAIRLHGPLPTDGEIVAKTHVTGLIDKGAGKGALMFSEKQVHDAATGTLIATTRSTVFLRGDGGFGGPAGPSPPAQPMPDTPPDFTVTLATRPEQALLYRLNGDDNPLHSDPAVAAKAGFPRPILHGLCTAGVVTHALLRALCDYDAARLKGWQLRFSAPVYPGETIVTEIWRDGSFRARVAERDVVVINNGVVRVVA